MRKKIVSSLGFASLLSFSWTLFSGCSSSSTSAVTVPSELLAPEGGRPKGAYIAYVVGCDKGCDQLAKGDLIFKINGEDVTDIKQLRLSKVATGEPVKLTVYKQATKSSTDVEIIATPNTKLPPIPEAPPFWVVGAQELDQAPNWARKNLFAHASPSIMLVNANGGIIDGRQLLGKRRFIVFWDIATREEQAQAADFLQVLQKAQEDLKTVGFDILFTQIQFPSNTRQAPWNDGQIRDFQEKQGIQGTDKLQMYRFPNATEYNAAREVGLEGATTYIQYLRASPTIVLLDENGIIRWHSEGIQPLPADSKAASANQYTIIQAITYAKCMEPAYAQQRQDECKKVWKS